MLLPSAARKPKFQAVPATSLAPTPPHLYTGTSGWAYPTWKPAFYPADVPTRAFLHAYGARLTSVEVNYTFRKLAEPQQLLEWIAATPAGFTFAFKAPQRITHFQRLQQAHDAVEEFVTSVAPMQDAGRLGPLLFQLPPNFKLDLTRLADVLAAPALKGVRAAFEFRHATWFCPETYALLRAHNVALCIAESEDVITPPVLTADFAYYRLRRTGGYNGREIGAFVSRLLPSDTGCDTFVYFKHEDEPTGALNAVDFLKAANRRAKGTRGGDNAGVSAS